MGLAVSLVCLLLCILTFLLVRPIQGSRTTVHLHLCICLFVGSAIFLAGSENEEASIEKVRSGAVEGRPLTRPLGRQGLGQGELRALPGFGEDHKPGWHAACPARVVCACRPLVAEPLTPRPRPPEGGFCGGGPSRPRPH